MALRRRADQRERVRSRGAGHRQRVQARLLDPPAAAARSGRARPGPASGSGRVLRPGAQGRSGQRQGDGRARLGAAAAERHQGSRRDAGQGPRHRRPQDARRRGRGTREHAPRKPRHRFPRSEGRGSGVRKSGVTRPELPARPQGIRRVPPAAAGVGQGGATLRGSHPERRLGGRVWRSGACIPRAEPAARGRQGHQRGGNARCGECPLPLPPGSRCRRHRQGGRGVPQVRGRAEGQARSGGGPGGGGPGVGVTQRQGPRAGTARRGSQGAHRFADGGGG